MYMDRYCSNNNFFLIRKNASIALGKIEPEA